MKIVDADGVLWDCPWDLQVGEVVKLSKWVTPIMPTQVPVMTCKAIITSFKGQGAYSYFRADPYDSLEATAMQAMYGVPWLAISDPNAFGVGSMLWNRVVGGPKARVKSASAPRVDCVCKKCNMRNEYAEPNQADGSYVCYVCRR